MYMSPTLIRINTVRSFTDSWFTYCFLSGQLHFLKMQIVHTVFVRKNSDLKIMTLYLHIAKFLYNFNAL